MIPEDLRSLVSANAAWFSGVHTETTESLAEVERRLSVRLPESLKWLLSEHGYSSACGVPGLEGSIEPTLRCRRAIGLPAHYIVLEDKGDAGVVLLDTSTASGRVIWMGMHELPRLAAGEPMMDIDEFSDFTAWVTRCLEDAKQWGNA